MKQKQNKKNICISFFYASTMHMDIHCAPKKKRHTLCTKKIIISLCQYYAYGHISSTNFFLIFFQQKNSKKYYPQNFLTFQNFIFYRGVGEHVDCLHHLQLITCGSVKNICQFSNFFLECICFHHLQLITCGTNELNVNNKLNFWNVFCF